MLTTYKLMENGTVMCRHCGRLDSPPLLCERCYKPLKGNDEFECCGKHKNRSKKWHLQPDDSVHTHRRCDAEALRAITGFKRCIGILKKDGQRCNHNAVIGDQCLGCFLRGRGG